MIILSELWSKSLDILRVLRYCVSLIGGDTRERLYAGAAPAVLPEPECADVWEEIEALRQELRETLQKPERRKLLRLVDAQNLLREETSLASFMAGFKLAWGLAQELEADGLYSFEDKEEDRVCRREEV